jgi:hypothetical protein
MNQEKINQEDYIDIPPLKRLIFQILELFFSILNLFSAVFRKRRLLLSIGLAAGFIYGYYYYYNRSSRFEVFMIVESSNLTKQTVAEMMKNLKSLISTQSYSRLSGELHMSLDHVKQIRNLATLTMDNEPLLNDTSTRFLQPFKISASLGKAELSDELQQSLIQYLNSKAGVKKLTEDQIKFNEEKLRFIDKELSKLDSLKIQYTHFLAASKVSATFYNNALDPAEIYKQSSALMKDKEEVMTWLSTSSQPIFVIDEFKTPVKAEASSLGRALFLGASIGIATCLLFGLLLELSEKTRMYSRKIQA